jgi:hypothetical protein
MARRAGFPEEGFVIVPAFHGHSRRAGFSPVALLSSAVRFGWLCLVLLTAAGPAGRAEAPACGEVIGQLEDHEVPVGEATIVFSQGRVSRTAATDATGEFQLADLEPGVYEVEVVGGGRRQRLANSVDVLAAKKTFISIVPASDWLPTAKKTQLVQGDARPIAVRYATRGAPTTEVRGLVLRISLRQNPIRLEARFHNQGEQSVTIVRQVDGSTEARRVPVYQVHVEDEHGVSQRPRPWFGCGNTNALMLGDVVEVPPQGSVDPFLPSDGWHFREGPLDLTKLFNLRPGRYRAWIEYSYVDTGQPVDTRCLTVPMDERLRSMHTPVPLKPPLEVSRLASNVVEFAVVAP